MLTLVQGGGALYRAPDDEATQSLLKHHMRLYIGPFEELYKAT